MAHDGQDPMTMTTQTVLLPDLLRLTGAALAPVDALFERARDSVREMVSEGGRVSGALIDANQTAAHGLSWLATYQQSLRQMQRWAEALQGSSALDFGWWFDNSVACITLHDIHHFNARIPSYRLRACHYGLPPEYAPRRIKFGEAVAALNLKLWDEDARRLVPFPPARRLVNTQAAG